MRRLVIGCGYIGRATAQAWAGQGDIVYAMTRSQDRAEDFKEAGWHPVVADITDVRSLPEVPEVDTVLFAVGMDRSRYDSIREVYVNGLANIISWLPETIDQLIYVSSTGVFGQSNGEEINESSPAEPVREGGRACLEAERLLANSRFGDRSTILRLAGIYGPGRIPSLQKIKGRAWTTLNPDGHINLIHRDDAVTAILKTAELGIKGEMILVSDGVAPLRRDYYQLLADMYGQGPIDWDANQLAPEAGDGSHRRSAGNGKRVMNGRMKELLKFELRWSDLRAGIQNAVGLDE